MKYGQHGEQKNWLMEPKVLADFIKYKLISWIHQNICLRQENIWLVQKKCLFNSLNHIFLFKQPTNFSNKHLFF